MSHGHSWLDIKQYTLSEIGVFIRSIYVKKELDVIENFSFNWMSSNLNQEGMQNVVKGLRKSSVSHKKNSEDQVSNDWSRLAKFSQKK